MVWWKKLLRIEPKDEEEGAKYILKKRTKKGGMMKVDEYLEPVDMEDLFEDLPAGIYALHKYQKGKSGFTQIWGPIEVTDDGSGKETPAVPKQTGSAMEQMIVVLKGVAELKATAQEEFDVIAPFFGYNTGKGETKSFIEQMAEAKTQYESLGGYFGKQTSGAEPIKYSGEVPIWLHPQLIPELIDGSMDKIERRLDRWGIIGEVKATPSQDEALPDFPVKPPLAPAEAHDVTSEIKPVVDIEIAFEPEDAIDVTGELKSEEEETEEKQE